MADAIRTTAVICTATTCGEFAGACADRAEQGERLHLLNGQDQEEEADHDHADDEGQPDEDPEGLVMEPTPGIKDTASSRV